ncbi:MAG: hypothetical protein PWQ51_274 [Methanolobus sp.]|jgi:hypothetical protein|nr:hypothetical protein [Methanolobus sp.]MDK2830571.1 hypothetical protein [Methanolobus sp.]MDK2938110.1 hypothetical protein [Methanolobus sp.]
MDFLLSLLIIKIMIGNMEELGALCTQVDFIFL